VLELVNVTAPPEGSVTGVLAVIDDGCSVNPIGCVVELVKLLPGELKVSVSPGWIVTAPETEEEPPPCERVNCAEAPVGSVMVESFVKVTEPGAGRIVDPLAGNVYMPLLITTGCGFDNVNVPAELLNESVSPELTLNVPVACVDVPSGLVTVPIVPVGRVTCEPSVNIIDVP
jgi:hypothetical protein